MFQYVNTFTTLHVRQSTAPPDVVTHSGGLINGIHERLITSLQYSKEHLSQNKSFSDIFKFKQKCFIKMMACSYDSAINPCSISPIPPTLPPSPSPNRQWLHPPTPFPLTYLWINVKPFQSIHCFRVLHSFIQYGQGESISYAPGSSHFFII